MPGCLTPVELRALLGGEAEPKAEDAATGHLERCPRCREALEALAGSIKSFAAASTPNGPVGSPALERVMRALAQAEPDSPADPAAEALAALVERLEPSTRPGALGRLGEHDILDVIEAGGMGIVLRGFDASLQRLVAIKVLYPMLAASRTARQRFLREARHAAAIRHEHVVAIYAVAEASGLPFIVMELVEGESLARRLKREGVLPVGEMVRLGRQIASGLAAAHANGIIHRDIKPANVLLESNSGRAKLTDFGLARAADDTGLTRSGFVAGTPEYLAPEQARDGVVDGRSDLFSLGCVLHAMATGGSPFHAESMMAVLRRVCELAPAPLRRINPAIPRWLGELTAELLSKDPSQRPASAAVVSSRLEAGAAGATARKPRRFSSDVRIGLAVLTLAVAIAVAALAYLHRSGTRDPVSPPAADRERMPFVVFSANEERLSGHEDILEAVAALPTNGILRLCWDGARVIPPVVLPNWAVSVRRMRGFDPLWVATHTNGPALLATAPLVLAGPEFEYHPPPGLGPAVGRADRSGTPAGFPGDTVPSGLSLVRVVGAPARLEGLEFTANLGPGPNRSGFACLQLDDCPRCEIHASRIQAQSCVGVVWRFGGHPETAPPGEATLAVTASGINAAYSDAVWCSLTPATAARLTFHRVSFGGRTVLFVGPDTERAASLSIEVEETQVSSDWLLIDRREDQRYALSDWISWRGDPTQNRPNHGFVPGRTRDDNPLVPDEEAWQRYWGPPAAPPRPRD